VRLGSIMPECHKLQKELGVMCSVFGLFVKMDYSIRPSLCLFGFERIVW
jgi:hypothetical protein